MKKFILLVLVFILLMPIMSLKAASISRLDVTGPDSIGVGDSFNVSLYIDVSGIDKNTLGVGAVVYEIAFDDSILSITKAYSNGFDTEVTTQDGRYFVTSVINDGNLASKCSDGVLHCGNYVATLTFYVKNKNASNTGINFGNGNALLYKVGSNYNESDSNIITSYSETAHIINIINKESVSTIEPKSIATNGSSKSIISKAEAKISKASQNDVKTSKKETTTVQNKSNNYLSSLKIKNHAIDFNKDKLEYNIYVKDGENKLTVNAKAESANATVKVTGADDLKNNNDLVTVEVTSEDGNVRTYKINIKHNKEIEKKEENNKKTFNLSKDEIKIIIIAAVCIVILISIVLIIKIKKNKKLNKMFDEFDKF